MTELTLKKSVPVIVVCLTVLVLLAVMIVLSIQKPRVLDIHNSSVVYREINYAFANRQEYSLNANEAVYRYYTGEELIEEKHIELTDEQYTELLEYIVVTNNFFSMKDREHKGNDGSFFVLEVSTNEETKKVTEYLESSAKMNDIAFRIINVFRDIGYVDDRISAVTATDAYKNASVDERKDIIQQLLTELKHENAIKYVYYSKDNYLFSFEYKDGTLGGVKIKDFDPYMNGVPVS